MRYLVAALIIAGLQACRGNDSRHASDTAQTQEGSPESTGPLTLTAADLDGFEKGLRREIELVREGQARSSNATTPQERGEAIQATFETRTIPDAAPASGLPPERYKLVRETVYQLLETLDFQDKIDGPKSMDMTRAGAEMKARMAGDPYAALDPSGAEILKSRLDRIVPIYVEYVNLTVVGG